MSYYQYTIDELSLMLKDRDNKIAQMEHEILLYQQMGQELQQKIGIQGLETCHIDNKDNIHKSGMCVSTPQLKCYYSEPVLTSLLQPSSQPLSQPSSQTSLQQLSSRSDARTSNIITTIITQDKDVLSQQPTFESPSQVMKYLTVQTTQKLGVNNYCNLSKQCISNDGNDDDCGYDSDDYMRQIDDRLEMLKLYQQANKQEYGYEHERNYEHEHDYEQYYEQEDMDEDYSYNSDSEEHYT